MLTWEIETIVSIIRSTLCTCVMVFVVYYSLEHLEAIQSQFHIDPLLLRLVVKKAAFKDLSSLVGSVCLSVILMRLAQECNNRSMKVR